mgnify:CR=1 FL=1
MKYDFTSIIDRKGKDAIAVDVLPNLLGPNNPIQVRDGLDMIPMWIADMNFPALPTITEAIVERAKHPILRQEMNILTASSDGMRREIM